MAKRALRIAATADLHYAKHSRGKMQEAFTEISGNADVAANYCFGDGQLARRNEHAAESVRRVQVECERSSSLSALDSAIPETHVERSLARRAEHCFEDIAGTSMCLLSHFQSGSGGSR